MPDSTGIPHHIRSLARQSLPAEVECLIAVGAETWRMHKAVDRMARSSRSSRQLRLLTAALRRQEDALNQAGLEWDEYDNLPFDPGMHVEVLHYETDRKPAFDKPVIVETVRPGFRFKGQIIRPAQVIVAGPAQQGD